MKYLEAFLSGAALAALLFAAMWAVTLIFVAMGGNPQ